MAGDDAIAAVLQDRRGHDAGHGGPAIQAEPPAVVPVLAKGSPAPVMPRRQAFGSVAVHNEQAVPECALMVEERLADPEGMIVAEFRRFCP